MRRTQGIFQITMLLAAAARMMWAADASVRLTTTDGSTKFSIQNSAAAEVASVDSQGNATFARVTQTGAGGNVILNQNSLQAAATFFVSSGTVGGPLTVGGILTAGTGANPITTSAGLLDAAKLTGNLPALNGSALISVTGANITGNISGNAASITGTITPGQISGGSLAAAVIASSVAAGAVQDASIVAVSASKLTGSVSDASIDSSSVTKQGNTFNAANELVKLDSSGNMVLPSGASVSIGAVRGSIVPSGTLILTTTTCPGGFTEYTAAGGYYLVGVPSGGTAAGAVGSAMTNLSNANHNHTVSTTTANFVSTLGSTPAVTVVTSPTGDVARGAVAPYFQIRLCSVP